MQATEAQADAYPHHFNMKGVATKILQMTNFSERIRMRKSSYILIFSLGVDAVLYGASCVGSQMWTGALVFACLFTLVYGMTTAKVTKQFRW